MQGDDDRLGAKIVDLSQEFGRRLSVLLFAV